MLQKPKTQKHSVQQENTYQKKKWRWRNKDIFLRNSIFFPTTTLLMNIVVDQYQTSSRPKLTMDRWSHTHTKHNKKSLVISMYLNKKFGFLQNASKNSASFFKRVHRSASTTKSTFWILFYTFVSQSKNIHNPKLYNHFHSRTNLFGISISKD